MKFLEVMKKFDRAVVLENKKLMNVYNKLLRESDEEIEETDDAILAGIDEEETEEVEDTEEVEEALVTPYDRLQDMAKKKFSSSVVKGKFSTGPARPKMIDKKDSAAYVLNKHRDELTAFQKSNNVKELIDFIKRIFAEDGVKETYWVKNFFRTLEQKRKMIDALTYVFDAILRGNGMGVIRNYSKYGKRYGEAETEEVEDTETKEIEEDDEELIPASEFFKDSEDEEETEEVEDTETEEIEEDDDMISAAEFFKDSEDEEETEEVTEEEIEDVTEESEDEEEEIKESNGDDLFAEEDEEETEEVEDTETEEIEEDDDMISAAEFFKDSEDEEETEEVEDTETEEIEESEDEEEIEDVTEESEDEDEPIKLKESKRLHRMKTKRRI